jgi:hypothetical protein
MLLQNDVNYFVGVGYELDSSRPDGRVSSPIPLAEKLAKLGRIEPSLVVPVGSLQDF